MGLQLCLHHFEELQLQTVGSTNCELSCGIRIAIDLQKLGIKVSTCGLICVTCVCVEKENGSTSGRPVEMDRTREDFPTFRNFDKISTIPMARCTLGMKRLELPQKRPEKCSFHRLSSNFSWFRFQVSSTILRNDANFQLNVYKVKSRSYRLSAFSF